MQTLGKASILAVGTELTSGQITNRNAPWISEKLVSLGIEVVLHETVADDRVRIREALERCSQLGQFLFVTGGLGPTTDDFTREVIAEWLDRPLEFNESSWQKILERLGKFKIKVAESNRRQCYFPIGSTIHPNPNGTAAGFSSAMPNQDGKVWVLPGPPNEVSAIWETSILPHLQEVIRRELPELKPICLFSWGCMGKSEAELGEITEAALAGSGLLTGYRAHLPIVEVKVWCSEAELNEKMDWIQKLEKVLNPYIVVRKGEDLAELLLQKLRRGTSIEIIDAASGGFLASRLSKFLRDSRYRSQAEMITLVTEWTQPQNLDEWMSTALQETDEGSITLALAGFTQEGESYIGIREDTQLHKDKYQSFYRHRGSELADRMRLEITEIALKRWCDWLDATTH